MLMQEKLNGLQESMFERLQKSGLKPLVLSTQYRMHPSIASFSNSAFYGGKLTNSTSPAQRLAPDGASYYLR